MPNAGLAVSCRTPGGYADTGRAGGRLPCLDKRGARPNGPLPSVTLDVGAEYSDTGDMTFTDVSSAAFRADK